MTDMACEGEGNGVAVGQCSNFCAGHIHSGNNHNNITPQSIHMQLDRGTHHFKNIDLAVDAGVSQLDMFGADTQNDILRLNVVRARNCLGIKNRFQINICTALLVIILVLSPFWHTRGYYSTKIKHFKT